jgi:hypothetical protein
MTKPIPLWDDNGGPSKEFQKWATTMLQKNEHPRTTYLGLHWRTWNTLLQIKWATDGEADFQINGVTDTRGLCVARHPQIRALERRGWIAYQGQMEVCDGDSFLTGKVWPLWLITPAGRKAIISAIDSGMTIQ